VFVLDVNDLEEDDCTDETPETVAKYIINHLLTSVTSPVGRCHFASCFVALMSVKT